MGTPLPSEITSEDGSTYQSGTEWEFEDGLNSAKEKGSPTTLLYQRTEKPKINLDDPELHEKVEQYKKVKAFFEHFRDAGGSLTASFAPYETIDAFREVLRQHLDSLVSGFLGQEFSEELGVTKAAVETMLQILKEQQVPPDHLEAKLKEIAERHLELTERLHALSKSNDEPEITRRREQATGAIERGDYDQAAEILMEAVAIDRRTIDEQQEALDRRRLSAAATTGQLGELERTRLNYREAAEHFAETANLTPTSENDTRLDYIMEQALSLYDLGRDFGDNSGLADAIEIYQAVLTERTRVSEPLDWAKTQMNLGDALSALGEREDTTRRLEQAVEAFSAALEERSRERFPFDWATTQNALGLALWRLSERENGTEKLVQAIDAFRAALEERKRRIVPVEWATTQNNLGLALEALGKRENTTDSLEKAINAYHAALKEHTRDRVPLRWAMTQHREQVARKTYYAGETNKSISSSMTSGPGAH